MADVKPSKRAPNFKDHTGERFGRLRVVSLVDVVNKKPRWNCACDCGASVTVFGNALVTGNTQSCGCWKLEAVARTQRTHGMAKSAEYRSWQAAKNRCFNPKSKDYPAYGGSGISMATHWRDSFEVFLNYMGPRPRGTSLDRIDNSRGYEPGNVRWASQRNQCRNKNTNVTYTHNGETLTIAEWSQRTGIPYTTLLSRFNSKLDLFRPHR